MKNFIINLKKYPLATCGLSLGLMGYFSLIDVILKWYDIYKGWYFSIISVVLSLFFITLLLIKTGYHKDNFKNELKCSLMASFLPTFSMVLMTWAGFIAGWNHKSAALQIIGTIIMGIAVLLHFALLLNFIINVMIKHKWHDKAIYGSWFVPLVGMVTAVTFANRFDSKYLPLLYFQVIWFIGFILFISSFFVFTYWLLFKTKSEHERRPSLAVYFAPVNLTLAGFCQAFLLDQHYEDTARYSQTALIVIFLILAMMSFALSIYFLIYCLNFFIKNKLDFIFAALTFPLAITSTAMFYSSQFIEHLMNTVMQNNIVIQIFYDIFRYYSFVYTAIAGIAILTILTMFLVKIVKIFKTKNVEANERNINCN